MTNRTNVCNAFEASGEFQTLVATLYGTSTSDNQRTENFVNNFYLGAYGRNATATELQQQRDSLNTAAAQSQASVQAQAESFGRSLFAAQVNDASLSNTQYVTNLYEAFLQRGPDAGGLGFWSGQASVGQGRLNVLDQFATCGAFRALAGTLYREANWLVADQLGTPRMIVNKSGSLSSVRRHDYLPFGEELFTGTGGRTTTQGYTGDSVRQKFTQKERDNETGLDYFLTRYYSSIQGRFTTADSWAGRGVNPQSFNRYSYVVNNPLKYIDLWGRQGELPKKKGKKGQGEEEIPPDRENDTDDGECPCPVYVIPAPGPKYIPDSRQIYDDWFDVLRGRFSFGSYMRNAREFLDQSARNGEAQGQQISNNVNEALSDSGLQFALTMTGPGSLLGAEDAAYVTVGRWMSQLELDKMLDTGIVQLSNKLPVTNVALPASSTAFIKQAEVGSVYVEFNVPRAAVVNKGSGWGLIPGPNSVYARLATKQGRPVPQMPSATNIVHKATKISN